MLDIVFLKPETNKPWKCSNSKQNTSSEVGTLSSLLIHIQSSAESMGAWQSASSELAPLLCHCFCTTVTVFTWSLPRLGFIMLWSCEGKKKTSVVPWEAPVLWKAITIPCLPWLPYPKPYSSALDITHIFWFGWECRVNSQQSSTASLRPSRGQQIRKVPWSITAITWHGRWNISWIFQIYFRHPSDKEPIAFVKEKTKLGMWLDLDLWLGCVDGSTSSSQICDWQFRHVATARCFAGATLAVHYWLLTNSCAPCCTDSCQWELGVNRKHVVHLVLCSLYGLFHTVQVKFPPTPKSFTFIVHISIPNNLVNICD